MLNIKDEDSIVDTVLQIDIVLQYADDQEVQIPNEGDDEDYLDFSDYA